ncbi:hypothetical protein [Pelagicoccus sp. SDUM812003]|uniref:hypothetical protein n=1 Tax=Pelagicoccus sp. SDUM812003 TaxID=3041267 RepID=UPI00280D60C5|nr:hypothetical protein [Pelagicoccus sp. SDUM812003]MDQ8205704.1 hypothetical protein [Pelagicoccus sp. SDUM812003]
MKTQPYFSAILLLAFATSTSIFSKPSEERQKEISDHFRAEIELFEPLSKANYLYEVQQTETFWDTHFDGTSIVAIGIIEKKKPGGPESDSDERESIRWIWSRDPIPKGLFPISYSDVTLREFSIKLKTQHLGVGIGSVRFGSKKYEKVISLLGPLESRLSRSQVSSEVQAICLIDASTLPDSSNNDILIMH